MKGGGWLCENQQQQTGRASTLRNERVSGDGVHRIFTMRGGGVEKGFWGRDQGSGQQCKSLGALKEERVFVAEGTKLQWEP